MILRALQTSLPSQRSPLLRRTIVLTWFCALLSSLSACSQKGLTGLEKDAVRECFRGFQQALARNDVAAAAAVLSDRTCEHYSQLRDAALTSDREQLSRLPLASRFEVLQLRNRMTADELRPLDGQTLAAHYIAQGWINAAFISRISLGNVILKTDGAEAVIADDGVVTGSRLTFHREDGGWKFNLAGARFLTQKMLERQMDEHGLSSDAVLRQALAEELQRPFESLWEPLASSGVSTAAVAAPSSDD